MTDDVGTWLYAVAEEFPGDRLDGLTGIGGRPVRAVAAAGLTAVAGTVDLAEFGAEAIHKNMEDLDWLAANARTHDAVVRAVADDRAVIPLRFATIYRDDDRARALLVERRADFVVALRQVTGRSEWGVRAYCDPDALRRAGAAAPSGRATTGTDYLLRRRAQLEERSTAAENAMTLAAELHACLIRFAVAGRQNPPQHPQLSGAADWTVLNGTYLVDNESVERFTEQVAELESARPHVHCELTGPWPPYSFTNLDVS